MNHSLLSKCLSFHKKASINAGDHDFSLRSELSKLLGKRISVDEISDWLSKNKILTSYAFCHWQTQDTESGEEMIYCIANDRVTIVYIKLNKIVPDHFFIEKESYLSATENISPLFLFVGTEDSNRAKDDKDLAHYQFIIPVLEKFFHITEDFEGNISVFHQFISDNKTQIEKILTSCPSQPKFLGGGRDGLAFSMGTDKALKFFTSKYLYDSYKQSILDLHKNNATSRTEMMVYDIGKLLYERKIPVYYCIMQKMIPADTIDSEVRSSIIGLKNSIKYYIHENEAQCLAIKARFEKNRDANVRRRELRSVANKIKKLVMAGSAAEIKDVRRLMPELSKHWLDKLVEEIFVKWLSSRGDLHMGNLGLTDYGEFRYFDPAHERWQDQIN